MKYIKILTKDEFMSINENDILVHYPHDGTPAEAVPEGKDEQKARWQVAEFDGINLTLVTPKDELREGIVNFSPINKDEEYILQHESGYWWIEMNEH